MKDRKSSFLNYMICYFTFVSLICFSKKPPGFWLAFIKCYGLLNTALLHSDKRKIVHQLQGSLAIYFNFFSFLFTLAKLDIYPYDVTNSYITNCHTSLAYMGLAKIIVAQDGTGSLFFKDVG